MRPALRPPTVALLVLAFGAAAGAAGAVSLEPGDLLVTDLNNARVLVVHATTGQVETLTPLGVENLLQSPSGIAMGFATRSIYAVDFADGDVVRIDPDDGAQERLGRLVIAIPPHFDAIDVGPEAWGIAVRQQGWSGRFGEELYVAAPNAIHHVTQDFFGEWSQTLESGDPALPDQPRAMTASELPDGVYRLMIAGGAGGYVDYAFPGVVDGSSLVPTRERVLAIHQLPSKVDTAAVLFDVENLFTCTNPLVVRPNGSGGAIWAEGGLLRCPVSVEIGFHGEVYVGDVESVIGGDARILLLTPDGEGGFHQRVLAQLPGGTNPYPADLELVRGQAEARLLGDTPSLPRSISADGSVIAGALTAETGFVFRNGAFEETGSFVPGAISADGTTMVGTSGGVPGRIRLDGDFEPFTEAGEGECELWSVSADGAIAGGVCRDPEHHVATRWSAPDAPTILGDLPGGVRASSLNSLSGRGTSGCGDGSVDAGEMAFRWTPAIGLQPLPPLPGHTQTRASAISLDGGTIVGSSHDEVSVRAVRWSPPAGAIPIGPPGTEFYGSVAAGVSHDGRVIVGNTFGDLADGPFLWTARHGLRRLDVELADVYGLPDPGFAIGGVGGLSADGRAIFGMTAGDDPLSYRLLLQAPEPDAVAGAAATLAALLVCAARRRSRRG